MIFSLFKNILICLSIILFYNIPILQIIGTLLSLGLYILVILKVKPFASKKVMASEIISDGLSVFFVLVQMNLEFCELFFDCSQFFKLKVAGNCLIGTVVLMFSVYLVQMVADIFQKAKELFQIIREKLRKKKVQHEKEKENEESKEETEMIDPRTYLATLKLQEVTLRPPDLSLPKKTPLPLESVVDFSSSSIDEFIPESSQEKENVRKTSMDDFGTTMHVVLDESPYLKGEKHSGTMKGTKEEHKELKEVQINPLLDEND